MAADRGGIGCPSCRHDNRPDRRFCTECGSRLGRTCAACAAPVEAGEKFCGACGASLTEASVPGERAPATFTPKHLAEKILGTRSAIEGERKQVTVLFADVKGSMDLAERLDPEEWHRIMDRFFTLLAEGVHRFEGTVVQFTGDGIMALFGAPIAHEDHAHRACWTALHLGETLRHYADELRLGRGLSFSVRIGINSGEVVVGRIGDDLSMEYTAAGHTVGLAARMEQIAAPDRVYLTDHTARLVTGFFRLRALGPLAVKGVAQPVVVHELEGAGALRTRLDASRARGFSRFVGRDEEMAALEAAMARALAGSGQVVGIVAEAGVGKSRLCHEFVQRCRARGLRVYEAHCVAHGRMIPFLPVLELLRGYFGITDQDDDQAAREKIAGRLLLLDRELTEALPLVFDFLGVADRERPVPRMDPEARQRQLFAATRRLIQEHSRREPGLVVMEDLHWVDGGSEAFVANHVEALAGTPALLLVNFRPEYHASWMQKSYYQQLPLLPLGAEATAELLRDLLGADSSLDGLAGRIGARAAGNPFFSEEIVQALVESGSLAGARGAYRLTRPVAEVAIPATVQAILAARIDRLPEREKAVVQTAAVIGREFGETVLARVAEVPAEELGAALRTLAGAELVYEQALFPEVEYAFKHPLTQEVAYRSQLGERRARVHAAVARAITALHPEKLDERAALLAHHWEAAGDALEAARWSARAAEWAGSSDSAEALRHWRKVRTLLATVPESAETCTLGLRARCLMLDIGWRLGMAEEEAATLFAEGRALAERSADLGLLAYLHDRYGTVRGVAGNVEEYLALSVEGLRLADGAPPQFRLELRVAAAYPHYLVGRLAEALELIETYLASAGENPPSVLGGLNIHAFAVWYRAVLLLEMGRIAEGERQLQRAEQFARDHGEAEILGWVQFSYVRRAQFTGEVEGALAHGRQCLEIALKIGSAFSQTVAYQALGRAHLLRAEWDESIAAIRQSLVLSRERGTGVEQEALALALLAEAYLGRGDLDLARAAAEEAVEVARRRGTVVNEPGAQLALARVLLRAEGAGARSAIETALDRALALARQTGGKVDEPEVHLLRAELAQQLGDDAARRRELGRARGLFLEMGAPARAEQVARQLEPAC